MSLERFQECYPILQKLAKEKSARKRRVLLSKAKNCVFYTLSEISRNVLKGNLPISEKSRINLKKYKKNLRNLAQKTKFSLKNRKSIINQSGGSFLPALLVPTIGLIARLVIDKVLEKK
jgi:DNA-binding PadR family transcriptional regulator